MVWAVYFTSFSLYILIKALEINAPWYASMYAYILTPHL